MGGCGITARRAYFVSSTIETDGVPASLLIKDNLLPGVTLIFSIQFAGSRKSCVDETLPPTVASITFTRIPLVDDDEPGKLREIAKVSVPKAAVEVAAPAAEATVSAVAAPSRHIEASKDISSLLQIKNRPGEGGLRPRTRPQRFSLT